MDDLGPAAPDAVRAGNLPEFTVSEISGSVKRTLEGAFGRVRVRGEITECRRYGSGHTYLSLKDESARLMAVVWKGAASRLGLQPENGLEVIATGRITSYSERSTYQLVIDRLEYAGAGAMLARIEALRLRLAAEGLFDPSRHRPLPMLPELVGVVTSAQGAVWHDIQTTVARRFPRALLLWPVPVQGEGAAARVAAAIAGMDALPPRPAAGWAQGGPWRPDVLIVARGGGSLEDLMAFNDEAVVRAAAACSIPLISAIGHETDTTLLDHAADRRAPTPTAAAELAVPARLALLADLSNASARLDGALHRLTQHRRLRLDRAAAALPDLPSLLGQARQRLDDRGLRLRLSLPNLLAARRAGLLAAAGRLPAPVALLQGRRASLFLAQTRLRSGLRHAIQARAGVAARLLPRLSDSSLRGLLRERRVRLEGLSARLEAVSYTAVLARGFALVLDERGRAVGRADAVRPGARLRLRFADGDAPVVADRQGRLF